MTPIVKKKICFIIVTLENGGTETYLLRFLKYFLDKFNVDITIFCKGNKGGALKSEYEQLVNEIVYEKVGYLSPKGILALFRVVKEQDVVCDLTGNFAGLPILLGKIAGVQKRVAFYRASTNHFKPSLFKNLYNALMNTVVRIYASDILSNSAAAFEYFFNDYHRFDSRFKVVTNGVKFTDRDLEKLIQLDKQELKGRLNLPIDKIIIGHVGRFNQAKNFPFIFKVIKLLSENKKVNFHFVFCGRGTDSNDFFTLLKNDGIANYCTSLGSKKNMLEVFGAFDCFFFPSITEGQPNALIEAMTLGLPFVASNIRPIAECMPDSALDQLVNINSVDSACNLLEEICLNPRKEKYNHQSWALSNFDPDVRFQQFARILLSD